MAFFVAWVYGGGIESRSAEEARGGVASHAKRRELVTDSPEVPRLGVFLWSENVRRESNGRRADGLETSPEAKPAGFD